jgi:spore coat polysaccharide biosynthesis protein SpsF
MTERDELPQNERPVVCISQARMGSTRLPGKVMLPILGRPMLYWHLSRLGRARRIDRLVVATTDLPQDEPIVNLCKTMGIAVFRGSEQDVLSRYAGACQRFAATTVVRVTSDCPLIDPTVVDQVIAAYGAARPDLDYAALEPKDYPRGLDTEVFTAKALLAADANAIDAAEREHVTPYLYRRPDRFRCVRLATGEGLGEHRWCVDEPADYELVRRIIETLWPQRPEFTWRDCLALLRDHPAWSDINRSVRQKTVA